ncbi:MAG: copper chaperone CopZ [Myxococcota bacterium]|jgi:copper chaperone CopZ
MSSLKLGRRLWSIGGLSMILMALASCTHTSVFSLTDLDCASCSSSVTTLVKKLDGVSDARFDMLTVEVAIDHDPAVIAEAELAERLRRAGFDAVVGPGKGRYQEGVAFPPGLDLAWLTRTGEFVDISKHAEQGKVTVFDFGAKWCSPCREVDAEMVRILTSHPNVALRKLDVVSWDTPLAQRALQGVKALPFVVVVDGKGREIDRISGLDLPRLRAAIERGTGR